MENWSLLLVSTALVAAPSGEVPKLALTLSVNGGEDGIEAFLLERARQTWENAEVLHEIRDTDELLTFFRVAVEWLSANQVSIRVEQDGQPLTDRTIEVQDPVQAKLTVWLLLKSTINRGLKQAELRQEEQGGGQTGWDFATGDRGEALTGETAEPVNAAAEAPGNTGPSTAATPGSTVTGPMEPRTGTEIREPAEVPVPSGEAEMAWTWGAMPTVWLETPKLFAFGVHATFALYWRFLILGAQLGYRYTDGAHGLSVHGFPLTTLLGFEIGQEVRAAAGLIVAGELKIPMVRNRTGTTVGAEGGLFAQARLPVSQKANLILRVAMTWRFTRTQYLFHDNDGNERATTERPWAQILSFGLEWR